MTDGIVRVQEPIGVIGGAPVSVTQRDALLPLVNRWVAADSGADHALGLGLEPERVIGDLDSISDGARARFADRLHHIREQDSTDFDKALRHIEAPLVLGVGFSGARPDHELAVYNVLVRRPDRPCVIVGDEMCVALCPPQLSLDLVPGCDLSLFPMATGRMASMGLVWATDGIEFAPDQRIGTSNRVAEGPVTLIPDGPSMLVFIPTVHLAAVTGALLRAPRWPARGQ